MNMPKINHHSVKKFFPINNQSVTQKVMAFVRCHPWAVGAAAVGITTVIVLAGVAGCHYYREYKTQQMYQSL